MKRNESAMRVVAETIRARKGLSLGIVLAVGAAVAASLCPPLLLGRVIDVMTASESVPAGWAIGYFALLALARTLCHRRPIMILDDPFSALDKATEKQVFEHLRAAAADSIVLLVSHRLYLFPQFDQVIWLSDGQAQIGAHETLMKDNAEYRRLYCEQEEEEHHEAK